MMFQMTEQYKRIEAVSFPLIVERSEVLDIARRIIFGRHELGRLTLAIDSGRFTDAVISGDKQAIPSALAVEHVTMDYDSVPAIALKGEPVYDEKAPQKYREVVDEDLFLYGEIVVPETETRSRELTSKMTIFFEDYRKA
jgi:hypothetical protein